MVLLCRTYEYIIAINRFVIQLLISIQNPCIYFERKNQKGLILLVVFFNISSAGTVVNDLCFVFFHRICSGGFFVSFLFSVFCFFECFSKSVHWQKFLNNSIDLPANGTE